MSRKINGGRIILVEAVLFALIAIALAAALIRLGKRIRLRTLSEADLRAQLENIFALVTALINFGKRGRQRTLSEAKLRAQLENISKMSGTEFEHYMARVFKSLGYDVTILGRSGDQGVDLLLRQGREYVAPHSAPPFALFAN